MRQGVQKMPLQLGNPSRAVLSCDSRTPRRLVLSCVLWAATSSTRRLLPVEHARKQQVERRDLHIDPHP